MGFSGTALKNIFSDTWKTTGIEIKNICASKDTIKRVKRQPTELEKLFANHISEKGPVSKICEEHLQLDNTGKQSNLKMGKGLKQTFLQRRRYKCQTSILKDAHPH